MPSEPDDAVVVEQVDREAAAALSEAVVGKTNGRDQIAQCRAGKQDDTFIVQAFARHRQQAIAAARPLIEREAWRPIETAPRDEAVPLLVYFDHDADPYQDPKRPGKLTDYACHAEGGDFLSGRGVVIAVWREGWHEDDGWESASPAYWMPAAWWMWGDGDASDRVCNPLYWMPLPAPPALASSEQGEGQGER